jgi:hypothetical protein
MVVICCMAGWTAAGCFGQRTVIHNAGAGKKMELIYDASGLVAESKTLSADGKLMEKNQYVRRPGFYAPQTISTGYWPDGKSIRTFSEMNYDENSNFTGEIIRIYDKAGKQTQGIKLSHNPLTGVFVCYHWDVKAGAYKTNSCPAGEGSSEPPEEPKAATYAEVMKQLTFAREARAEQEKVARMGRMTPVTPPIRTEEKQADVILPRDLRPGEHVSGSVVESARNFENLPGIRIIRMRLPFETKGAAATLRGWTVEAAGSARQLAIEPVTFTVPREGSEFTVTLRQVGDPAQAVSERVPINRTGKSKPPAPRNFEVGAICLKTSVCAVLGPLSGDSNKTIAAFGSRPARIVAETENTAYFTIPEEVKPGVQRLIVSDGLLVAALPVDIAEVSFNPPRKEMKAGTQLLVYSELDGPDDLPDATWHVGTFPAIASLESARRLVPGFELPPEAQHGVLLLVIRNVTPGPVSLRGSKNQTFSFTLTPRSFERGEFKYKFVADALKSGPFTLQASILPFLAPVRGQQFSLRPGAK